MPEMISVVVPVFNNQPTLEETCRQIIEIHESGFKDLELEVIFVNDGSTDKSWEELVRLKDLYKVPICLLNLSRNFGQLAASFAGFNSARGDAVICVSADLQDPISLMGKMVAYWRSNTEIVICYRENRDDGFFSRIFSIFAYSIARVSCPELPRGGFDYWLMSRNVCKLLCSFKVRHNVLQGYLLSVGFSKAFIPYVRMERKVGRSGYTFWKKLKIAIDILVDSYVPIRFMSFLGAFISLCGVIYSLLIVYAWYMHEVPFSGWAPLMIVSMIIGGIIMVMLGVIGEYIWRIYENLKDFPLYIIDTKSMPRHDENQK
jgi:polyisoprenyl-phosphate glycosyltransferase